MTVLKVLIAEDEPDVLEIMSKNVYRVGYDVITAVDGKEAWEKIQSEVPDVIVLDVNMPKMNGLEVLKNVRTNPASLFWQPVIIVSVKRELDDLKKGFSLEADHYITKPCQVDMILKAIKLFVNLIPQRKMNLDEKLPAQPLKVA